MTDSSAKQMIQTKVEDNFMENIFWFEHFFHKMYRLRDTAKKT